MPQCQTCKSEMNSIPAGVSKKTGKSYNQFYSCPNRCPKPSYSQTAPPVYTKPEPPQEKPDEVQNHIRWCNSLNNSCLIIANDKNSDGTLRGKKEDIESLANFIYKLEPKGIDPVISKEEVSNFRDTEGNQGSPSDEEEIVIPF